MRLRRYHHLDISALVEIQLQCDRTDPLACYMVQNTEKYPATYRHTTLRFLRTKLLEPGTVAFVVETDDTDNWPSACQRPPGTIVGWSVWTRHGNSLVARDWQKEGKTVACAVESALHGIQNCYFDLLDPTANHRHIPNVLPIISKSLISGDLRESWELNGMYVSPGWQRRGVGNMLLQWGLERAAEEYIPIVCKSTSVGVYFYEHAGFRSLEKQMLDLYFDPGHKGYHSMVWYPREWEKQADTTHLQSEHDEMADLWKA